MHCKQKKAKKGNEPPKRRTCSSQCSECPFPIDPIPFAVAAAPSGVHIMPSLQPRLRIGRSQRLKCHHSAVQRFSPYLSDALQANERKKGNEPPERRTCPSQCSQCPSPMDRTPFAVATAPLEVHIMPSLQPRLPITRSRRLECHQSAVQRFLPSFRYLSSNALSMSCHGERKGGVEKHRCGTVALTRGRGE